jgi:hypothetical protein
MIVAKLSFSIRRSQEPIVFRLFDATAGVELTRASVINNSSDYIQTPIPLVYVGQIPMAKFTTTNLAKSTPENIVCDTAEDCGCTDTTCVEGEQNCITPNISYVDNKYSPNSHLIKVQFHVVDFHGDYWDRYFGTEIDNNAASISSINAMIFDASPATTYVHRQGTATFNNTTSVDIVFDKELTTNKYSISLCANKNIQIWYTNKTSKGFTINSELAFQGFVDWTLLNISDK